MYAEINQNVVVNLFTPPEGFGIEDCFHPSLLFNFIDIGDNENGVSVGDVYDPTEETFSTPEEVVEEVVAEEPAAEPVAEEPVAP